MAAAARALSARFGRGLTIVALATALVGAFLVMPPHSLYGKLQLIGFAICHQMPERSFHLGGLKLPLCSRDTGTYLGALATLVALLASRRRRRNGLPVGPVMVLLGLAFVFFAVDGVNSYADSLPVVPQLYPPSNHLRLLSGMGCGIAIVAIVLPLFNYSVWRDFEDGPILTLRGFVVVLATAFPFYVAVAWGPPWLYYPLALAVIGGVLIVLSLVNGLLAYLIAGFERHARSWLDALPILAAGLIMTALELGVLGYVRYALERVT